MKEKDSIIYKNWFFTYSDSFLTSDQHFNYHIILKREHCKRVAEEIVHLGRSLGLPPEDLRLCEVTGLYHDLGRFEQYKTYKTFSDEKSVDHADFGEQIVKDNGIFDNSDKEEISIILSCIRCHNKLSLSDDLKDREKFFVHMLRDADKLDIWKVLIEYYLSENKDKNPVLLDLPDSPAMSEKVINAVNNKTLAKKEHIKSVNDFIILNMSWVFDLNFPYTFQQVSKRSYIDTLISVLPDTEQVREMSETVQNYLENNSRLKQKVTD